MLRFEQISKIQVELTTRCNARCPMCMRNYRGSDYNSGYPDCELSIDHIQHILSPVVIRRLQQNTQNGLVINFNGNLGDFASARDAAEIVEYLADQQVTVTINTNGSLRNTTWWSRLARPGVTVGFAIDGLADTHSLYRQDTDWHKIIANAQAFIAAGGQAVWRFVPFDHNRHQESACRDMAQQLGFVRFENIYDGRDRTPVYTRTGQFSHHIGKPYDGPVPKISDMLVSHVTWYDSKTVQVPADVTPLKLNCTHKMNREIYIAADGTVYPCCYLGFYPATMTHPGNDQLRPLLHQNNALEYDLEHCMNWFDQVERTWAQDSIANGRLYHCVSNCGRTQ
jgi:sulfatase maturation enzyme AslB (radical SAM superfamily)